MKALDKQVGDDHYKGFKIQPYEFFIANKIPYHKASIIKRIMRYDLPTGGGLEDLEKIKHEVDLIIELESWNQTEPQTQQTLFILEKDKDSLSDSFKEV